METKDFGMCRNPDKIYGNIVIGNLDRPAGECLRFRHNENGAWFEYVPPQYTGQGVRVFELDNPAVVHSLKQMLEGV
jgi:hypothetical protein